MGTAEGRGALLGIQSLIGVNYLALNGLAAAIRAATTFAIDFEQALADIKAVAGLTDTQVGKLADTISGIAAASKFSTLDLTEAAKTLAQAGYSGAGISASLKAISELAAVAGTDLKSAVDIVTTTITAFDLATTDTTRVVDTFTQALNLSKLNIQQLQLGFQYVGSVAAQSGVTFEEVTATLAGMADAGIRSGSTLGTGLRQVINELLDPSEAFAATVKRLGLTLTDVDVKAHGIVGALRNLRDAGFTTTDALRSFELRGAAAASTILNQIGSIERLQIAQAYSASTSEAAAEQLGTLANRLQVLQNVTQGTLANAFAPLQRALADTVAGITDVVSILDGPLLRVVTSAAAPALGVLLAGSFARTTVAAARFALGMQSATSAMSGLLTLVTRHPLLLALATAAAAAGAAFSAFGGETESLTDRLEAARTRANELSDSIGQNEQAGEAVAKTISRLVDRYADLKNGGASLRAELVNAARTFGQFGLSVDVAGTNVDGLIAKLRTLQLNIAAARLAQLDLSIEAQGEALAAIKTQIEGQSVAGAQAFSGRPDNWSIAFPNPDVGINQAFLASLPPRLASLVARLADPQAFTTETTAAQAGNLDPLARLLSGDGIGAGIADQVRELRDYIATLAEVPANVRKLVDATGDRISKLNELMVQAGTLAAATAQREELKAGLDQVDRVKDFSAEIDRLRVGLADIGRQLAAETDPAKRQALLENSGFGKVVEDLGARISAAPGATAAGRALGSDIDVGFATLRAQFEDYGRGVIKEASDYTEAVLEASAHRAESEIRRLIDDAKAHPDKLPEARKRFAALSAQAEDAGRRLAFTSSGLEAYQRRGLVAREGDAYVATEAGKRQDITGVTKAITAYDKALDDLVTRYEGFANDLDGQARRIGAAGGALLRQRLGQITRDLTRNSTIEDVQAAQVAGLDDIAHTYGVNLEGVKESLAAQPAVLPDLDALGDLSAEARQTIEEFVRATLRAVGKTLDVAKSLSDAAKDAESAYKDRLAQIEAQRAEIARPAHQFGALGDAFAAYGNDTLAEVARRAATIETRLARPADIAAQGQIVEAAQARVSVLESQLAEAQARLAEYKASGASPTVIDATERAAVEGARDLVEARRELLKVTTELTTAQEAEKSVRDLSTASIGDAIASTLDLYAQSLGGLNDINATLSETLVTGLDAARSGFGSFFSDLATGAKTGGEAFAELGRTMLRAMLDVVTSKLAAQFIELGLSLFGGGGVGKSAKAFNAGGSIPKFAAGGQVTGPITTRDSRLISARPGEYVLRSSAVQAIGLENLERLNALGNRVVGGGERQIREAAKTPPPPPPAPSVNLWVVTPDQRPPMGPNDVELIVADNMTRGGSIKRLVKQIVAGTV